MNLNYKEKFIQFMSKSGVLLFGEFTLKSGRISPYFINTGNYCTGEQVAMLGEFYAECIVENNIDFETLFGPAYKGIPLAVATAAALWKNHSRNVSYLFNRKEAKDHGEGGVMVGKKLSPGEKVIIIEDVMTSGKAMRESIPLLHAEKAVISGMVISIDRQERGTGSKSAVNEAEEEFGIKVYSIVNMQDVINAVRDNVVDASEHLDKMLAYRQTYGV